MEQLEKIFAEFLEEGISAESKARYGPAVSNYYKALSILCSHLIISKLRKTPKNHAEIFLFLKVSFPEVYEIVDAVFTLYTDSYSHIWTIALIRLQNWCNCPIDNCANVYNIISAIIYNEQGGLRKTQRCNP